MEKYLMSSPRSHFDYEISNLDLNLDDYDQIDMSDIIHQEYDYDQPFNANYQNQYSQHARVISNQQPVNAAAYQQFNYQSAEIVPKSNISLTDNMNLLRHQSHMSITSNQDLTKIVESNSFESIPQLTSSVSNQSLESPNSFMKNPNSANGLMMTPRKVGRNKSLSVGSYNLQTPMRSQTSPSSSAAKISKTPFKHSRSLSRTKLETKNLNPFYTPNSFISPKYDSLSFDNDDFQTPLQPIPNSGPHSGPHSGSAGNLPQFNLPYNSPELQKRIAHPGPLQFTRSMTQPSLKRDSTLESIKIEDQEDDALKQLKRAKSYSNFRDYNTLVSTTVELGGNSGKQAQSTSVSSGTVPGTVPGTANSSTGPNSGISTAPSSGFGTGPSTGPSSGHSTAPINETSSSNIQLIQSQFSNLKSYPASINLASIANNKLLPGMSSMSSSNLYSMPIPGQGGSSSSATSSLLHHSPNQSVSDKKKRKETSPEFIPDLPIKINEKASDLSDPKKKHACPLCLARFQRPEHVKRHMKSHSSEKPFECDQPNCNKRFNRKDNLKAHLKKIHSKT